MTFSFKRLDGQSIEWISFPGLVSYEAAMQKMSDRIKSIQTEVAAESVWFLEHAPIYTLGSGVKKDDLKVILPHPLIETSRGGKVTFHGPGQLVAYLMLDLRKRHMDVRAYVQTLEKLLIEVFHQLGLSTVNRKGRVGLWVPVHPGYDEKITAVGIRIQKWVTSHGFAININLDLKAYSHITPCGIYQHGVTSLQEQGIIMTRQKLENKIKQVFPQFF